MSNDATSMYSTWFSIESAGYCERSLVVGFIFLGDREGGREEPADVLSSRTMGGCGDRPFLASLRREMDEADLEVGNEENDCCRCNRGGAWPAPLVLCAATSVIATPCNYLNHIMRARLCGGGDRLDEFRKARTGSSSKTCSDRPRGHPFRTQQSKRDTPSRFWESMGFREL